ncbi:MAG: hypothetical protein R3C20_03170 [Planctomycetaceae bacterium]
MVWFVPECTGLKIMASSPTQRFTALGRLSLRRNLRAMNVDGISFSIMVGMSETYLPAFVLAPWMGELTAAMIATVPILLGSGLQLVSAIVAARIGSYRLCRWDGNSAGRQHDCTAGHGPGMRNVAAWAVYSYTIYWASDRDGSRLEYMGRTDCTSSDSPRFLRDTQSNVSYWCSDGINHWWTDSADVWWKPTTPSGSLQSCSVLVPLGDSFLPCRLVDSPMDMTQRGWRTEFRTAARRRADNRSIATMFRSLRYPGDIGRFVFFLMAVQTAVHISGRTLPPSYGSP